jgi:hypothetical protein
LEAALENRPTRPIPTRSASDSPVSPSTKRTKIGEPDQKQGDNGNQGKTTIAGSNPVNPPEQDQTLPNRTLGNQTQVNQTQSQTPSDQTQRDQTSNKQSSVEENSRVATVEAIKP